MLNNHLTGKVIGCAIEVHRTLGAGLLEAAYENCLLRELEINGIAYQAQYSVPIEYKGIQVKTAYRIDVLVENSLILEFKSVESFSKLHEAQILTYMRLSRIK
jgi:GxxExxY protein